MIGVALFTVSILVIVVWFLLEFKRLKHRLFAVFIICLILFLFFSGAYVFKDKEFDYKTVPGILSMMKTYCSWMFSVSGNFKTITSNAVHMDWSGNSTK